jgi:hypothetical protein
MDHVRSLARAFGHGLSVQAFAAGGLQTPVAASQSTATPFCIGQDGPPCVHACVHTSGPPVNPWQFPDMQSCSLKHGS